MSIKPAIDKTIRIHPHYVTAECKDCEHMWRLKGITQLTSLFEFEDDEITSLSPSSINPLLQDPPEIELRDKLAEILTNQSNQLIQVKAGDE